MTTTTPTHIMLDLETWGTTPGSDLRSIGAVVFDPVAGTLGEEFYVNVENPAGRFRNGVFESSLATGKEDYRRWKLTRDPETVNWWAGQSAEAQAALAVDVVPLDQGLGMFGAWFADLALKSEGEPRIWAHGSTFDVTLLAAAWEAVFPRMPLPWHYRAPRDTRTIFDAAGGVEIPTNGTYHNALDDAKNQALAVIEAYRKLGIGGNRFVAFKVRLGASMTLARKRYAVEPGQAMFPGSMVCIGIDGKLRLAREGDAYPFRLPADAEFIDDVVKWALTQ